METDFNADTGADAGTTTQSPADLVAELNDLLKLDHDAVQAYTLAIKQLREGVLRNTLMDYRSDHQRHIDELHRLIEAHGGSALELPHLVAGPFKLAIQALGGMVGDDRTTLLAFKTNEYHVMDKYNRAAESPHPADTREYLTRAADDERRHYDCVGTALEQMGAGGGSIAGTLEHTLERLHGAAADILEGAEKRLRQ